jgi:hypothetical protein
MQLGMVVYRLECPTDRRAPRLGRSHSCPRKIAPHLARKRGLAAARSRRSLRATQSSRPILTSIEAGRVRLPGMAKQLDKAFEEVSGCRTGLIWFLLAFPPVFLLLAAVESPGKSQGEHRAVWILISVFCVAFFVFQRWQRARALGFLRWLWDHRDAVRSNGSLFGETRIQSVTELAQFELVFSMVFMATRQRTSYVVAGTGPAAIARLCATLVTLLLGWWSLHGIGWTLAALIRNLSSGSRTTAGAILDAVAQRVEKLAAA